MTKKISFATLKDVGFQRLVAIIPQIEAHCRHPAVKGMAVLMALLSCRLMIEAGPADVGVTLTVDPAPRRDPQATELFAMMTAAIESPVRQTNPAPGCEIGQWLDGLGLVDLVSALLRSGATREMIAELAGAVSAEIENIFDRTNDLREAHFATIIDRDLPCYRLSENSLTDPALWALAPGISGMETRPVILKRRLQALEIYGSLASVLAEPSITAAIDRADELIPVLCARLHIEPAKLRRLSHARSLRQTFEEYRDYSMAVRELTAHSVPLYQWPAPEEWGTSPWIKAYSNELFRVDYVGDQNEPRDAVRALHADILLPVAAARAAALGMSRSQPVSYILAGH